MLNDILANALSKMKNQLKRGKSEVTIQPTSKLVRGVLEIMKEQGYIKDFKEIQDRRGGSVKVQLGEINAVNVIKPRFSVMVHEIEKFEKRYLPAKDFGVIIISTSKGLMTHYKAKEQKIGGTLIAYAY